MAYKNNKKKGGRESDYYAVVSGKGKGWDICMRIRIYGAYNNDSNSRSTHQLEAHRPQYKFILRSVTTASFPRSCGLKNTRTEVAVSGLGQQNRLQFFSSFYLYY